MYGVRKVGRYELLELLGRGGMADVYLAHVSGIADFKRLFAVKMIRTDLPEWERYGQFFIDEARITVQLRHPNIVQVFDLGMSEFGPYLGMEYVDGPDLRQLIGWSLEMRKGVPFNLAVFIARELLQALSYAHSAEGDDGDPLGIVHRDISPSNVLLSTSGEVKLSDFGVAMATIATQAQNPGAVVGKARYFAPEVARREPATALSDMFSLSAVLFDMFTGKPLVEGSHYTEIVANLEVFDIEQRLESVYSLPADLEKIFQHALAADPADRYPSARAMLDHLDDFIYDEGIRVNRAHLSDYLKGLEEFIVTSESASFSSLEAPGPAELSSVWSVDRSANGSRDASLSLSEFSKPSKKSRGQKRQGRVAEPPSTLAPGHRAYGRRASGTGSEASGPVHEVSSPAKPTRGRQTPATGQPAPEPGTAGRPSSSDGGWDQGAVLALPDAKMVKLCDPHRGPIVLTEANFDDRLVSDPPEPDALVAFDESELRPFHEWARMGNPRTTVHGRSQVHGATPLSIGATLLRMVSPSSRGSVVQLFDGRQAIGLIVDGDTLHGAWTEELGTDLLLHLADADVISHSQCQVLSQLAAGNAAAIPDLAARHGILSTTRMYHEARQALHNQLERMLLWPTWRLNRLVIEAEGWGPEKAGINFRSALERAARNVFSLDWFLGLLPDMLDATIRPRHRSISDDLDNLLGKGTLRVRRQLPPGCRVRDAVSKPSGEPDEVRSRNLYELVVTGLVELAQAAPARDFRRSTGAHDG